MKNNQKKRSKFTSVSIWHFIRLGYRSVLLIAAVWIYISYRIHPDPGTLYDMGMNPVIQGIIWIVFMVEMFLRLFPSKLESPGSQKQFARNYMKSGSTQIDIPDNNATMLVALIWVCFNLIFGALYMAGILDDGIMVLLSCGFAVCDMICILFFCPFQSWFLHNKCCGSCRIYNWDYAMMFTPLFFVRTPYTWGLLLMSIILLVRWEITFYRFPERFSEKTNEYLRCENCTEKLCSHKKQLHSLWKQVAAFSSERTKRLRREEDNV